MGLRTTIKNWINKTEYVNDLHAKGIQVTDIPLDFKPSKLVFPYCSNPTVSIIIPFYNQEAYTWSCLNSIYQHLPTVSFEILLINDNSSDSVDFSLIENIQVINNPKNLGFLKSVNRGISLARGEYIYLLNNDTIVKKGFLDALYEVFETYQNVGAVGSKLLNSDGSLQEAGCIFTKDGNISQIVKKEHYYPEVNYIYKVDYCSGCSLLFKKYDDNHELNLFDEQFAPAYFEETDLCFSLRYLQGKDIYYTPFSQVIHFNGVSYNSKNGGENQIKQQFFQKNLKKFKFKWSKQIADISALNAEQRILELYDNKSIVFFYYRLPEYDNNSGDLRLTEIIKAFKALGYHITLIVESNRINNSYLSFFQKTGVSTYYEYRKRKGLRKFINNIQHISPICWFYTADVFISHYKTVQKLLQKPKLVFDMVDIHHLRLLRMLELDPLNKDLKKWHLKALENEKIASSKADIVIPISDEEGIYMEKFCSPDKMTVISNVHYPKVNIEQTPSFQHRIGLLFIGSKHLPNIDSVQFLYEDIMPHIWKTNPEIELQVVGDVNTLLNISHPKIKLLGHVPDITEYFLNSKLMVAPLRYGAGVKGKIGQAFEYYLPVVTSKIGAEGMQLIDGETVLLAETAEEFAEKILLLYTDEGLWKKIQTNSERGLRPFSRETLFNKIKEIETKVQDLVTIVQK
ncbi:MAG: hypothetical protein K0S24_2312 [Sphingobacterium sp.]|jgi:GT2 family glycosyltransferase|nr:hypothetical protein [Sphingobacterium sp.]